MQSRPLNMVVLRLQMVTISFKKFRMAPNGSAEAPGGPQLGNQYIKWLPEAPRGSQLGNQYIKWLPEAPSLGINT
jgi:hypothetical protein